MKQKHQYIIWAFTAIVLGLIAWYFIDIVVYLIIAAVLSLIGRPLVKNLDEVKIGKFQLPHALNTGITMFIMVVVMAGFLFLLVPLITQQAELVNQIDQKSLGQALQEPAGEIKTFLNEYELIPEGESLESILTEKLKSIVNLGAFSDVFKNVLGVTGSFFMGTFSVLFLLFFFLKDDKLLINIILALIPEKGTERAISVMKQAKNLLTRYFIGLCIEISSMITLLITGLSIMGVSNAILIGFLGGMLNVIPYLGPIIGASIGTVLAIIAVLSAGTFTGIGWVAITVIGVFLAANLVDNILLQPLIYSNSVKAHPIEIFLVIIMAGSLAGIPGMVLAIPSYTVLRILAKEFLGNVRIVQKLTDKM